MFRKFKTCLLPALFTLAACPGPQTLHIPVESGSTFCEPQTNCLLTLLRQQDLDRLSRYLLVAPPEKLSKEESLEIFAALWTYPVALRRFLQRYPLPQAFQNLPNEEALKLLFFQNEINPSLNPDLLQAFRQLQQQSDHASPLLQDLRLFWHYWLAEAIQKHNGSQFKALIAASDYLSWDSHQKQRLKAQALRALNFEAFEVLGGELGDPLIKQKDSWLPFLNRKWQGELTVLDYWLEHDILDEAERQALLQIVSGNNAEYSHHPEAMTKLLQAGQSLTLTDARGLSALHYYLASSGASWSLMERYIDLTQHLKHFDENGNSLLMYAARGGNMDIIQKLQEAGVSPHLRSTQQERSNSILITAPAGSSVLTQSLGNRNLDAFYYFSESLDIYAEPRNLVALALQRIALPGPENSSLRRQQTRVLWPTLVHLAKGYPIDQEAWDQLAFRQCYACIPLFMQNSDISEAEIIKSLVQSTQLLLEQKAFFELGFYTQLIHALERQFASIEALGVLSFNQALKQILLKAQQQNRLLASEAENTRFFQALRSQELRMLSRFQGPQGKATL